MRRNLDGVKVECLDAFEPPKEAQRKLILRHMQAGHRIDGMKSLDLYGCNRLPARIIDIQKATGIIVDRNKIKVRGKWYKEYFLRGTDGK